MKQKSNRSWLAVLALVALIPAVALLVAPDAAFSDNSAASASANSDEAQAEPRPKPKLDGAKVYAWNCGSCHSERYPSERNDADWELIATHMRVRANLTAAQTEAVLEYLQGNN